MWKVDGGGEGGNLRKASQWGQFTGINLAVHKNKSIAKMQMIADVCD